MDLGGLGKFFNFNSDEEKNNDDSIREFDDDEEWVQKCLVCFGRHLLKIKSDTYFFPIISLHSDISIDEYTKEVDGGDDDQLDDGGFDYGDD